MSLATNATDKQVGEILETIQGITPEVVAQAVQYHQAVSSLWLGVFLAVGLVLMVVFRRCLRLLKVVGQFDNEGYILGVFLSGCGIAFCFVGCAACINDLVKLTIAPDYYAVECLTILFGR